MPQGIATLPTELLLMISTYLGPEDFYNLGRGCKRFYYELIHDPIVCSRFLKSHLRSTQDLWPENKIPSDQAASIFRALVKRNQAIVRAEPFTATLISLAVDFVLVNGVLAYKSRGQIRILDTTHAKGTEIVVDYAYYLPKVAQENHLTKILHYAEGIISCLVTWKTSHMLLVLDARKEKDNVRYLECCPYVVPGVPMFVRNNSDYLVYGIKSEVSSSGNFNRWALWVFDLNKCQWNPTKRVLASIVGSDIGRTLNFEIFDGYLYAVANRNVAEVSNNSYGVNSSYYAVRFPLDRPTISHVEETDPVMMFRRRFNKGGIDNRWTQMSLERDNTTGDIMVCEQRLEWLNGQTHKTHRTCYRQKIIFPTPTESKEPKQPRGVIKCSGCCWVDSDDEDEDFEKQQCRTSYSLSEDDNLSRGSRNLFHASDIRLRQYDTSSGAFIDFVQFEQPDRSAPNLRVRTICPRNEKLSTFSRDGKNTSIWPRTNHDAYKPEDLDELMNILNPPRRVYSNFEYEFQYDTTYSTIAYTTESKLDLQGNELERWLVLVSFDPRVRFDGLRKWNQRESVSQIPKLQAASDADQWSLSSQKAHSQPPAPKTLLPINEFMSVQPAMYLCTTPNEDENGYTSFGYDFSS